MLKVNPDKLAKAYAYMDMETDEAKASATSFWVSPCGRKFPIRFCHHEHFLEIAFNMDIDTAEIEGWARISNMVLQYFKPLTQAQRCVIRKLSITHEEDLTDYMAA